MLLLVVVKNNGNYEVEITKYETMTMNALRAIRFFFARAAESVCDAAAPVDEESGTNTPPVRTRRGC